MDIFPELERAIEEIGFILENFDFEVHNDVSNPDHIESAKQALENLSAAVSDLVP